jgi:hypothetical protein
MPELSICLSVYFCCAIRENLSSSTAVQGFFSAPTVE